jgi:hypothetical protein
VGKKMAEYENSYHNLLESDLPDLKKLVDGLYKKHFENKNSATLEELRFGARLARSKFIPQPGIIVGHLPNWIFTA